MSEYIAHTETVRGYTIQIIADYDAEHANPRHDDQLGVMLCEHRDYRLGDRDGDVDDFKRTLERFAERRNGIRAFVRWLKVFHGTTVVLPLYLHDHSGITISAGANMLTPVDPDPLSRRNRFMGDGAGWDTSTVGFIFDTAKTREMTGAPIESIEEQLQDEVKEYALYLEGHVYGYVISNPDGEEVEACWGFVCDYDGYVLEEARHCVPDEPAEVVEANERKAIAKAAKEVDDDGGLLHTVLTQAPLPWLRSWAETNLPTEENDR